MKKYAASAAAFISLFALLALPAQSEAQITKETLLTYADGRPDGGIRQSAEVEDGLDSPGDVFVFDQKLLAADAETVIGRNAGYCIRTDPGAPDFSDTNHPSLPDSENNNYGHCSWTLVFNRDSGFEGSLTVTGRESDRGHSRVPIVGGTGDFFGATGVLITKAFPQDAGGVLFRQKLIIYLNEEILEDQARLADDP